MPQSDLVLSIGSSIPDCDGGGEDRLGDGRLEVNHHCVWQVELLQLPQEIHPLLSLFDEVADVQLPLEVLGDDGAQGAAVLHSVWWGVTAICMLIFLKIVFTVENNNLQANNLLD